MSEITGEWGWMRPDGETAFGPFSARADAIDNARTHGRGDVIVGRIVRYDGSEYMPDVDRLLEIVNESAAEDDFYWLDDDAVTLAGDETAAAEALMAWARKWLRCDKWVIDGVHAESVYIEDEVARDGVPVPWPIIEGGDRG